MMRYIAEWLLAVVMLVMVAIAMISIAFPQPLRTFGTCTAEHFFWRGILPPCRLPLRVSYDDALGPKWHIAILQGINAWNSALDSKILVRSFKKDNTVHFTVAKEKVAGRLAIWRRSGDFYAACDQIGTIFIDSDIKYCEDRYRRIAIHELGHALGLQHVDAIREDSVMQAITPACGDKMHDSITNHLIKRVRELAPEGRL
jgi:hypothetical protein